MGRVAIQSDLPAGTTIDIVDYIFDHVMQVADQVTIHFHVAPTIYLPVVFKNF